MEGKSRGYTKERLTSLLAIVGLWIKKKLTSFLLMENLGSLKWYSEMLGGGGLVENSKSARLEDSMLRCCLGLIATLQCLRAYKTMLSDVQGTLKQYLAML